MGDARVPIAVALSAFGQAVEIRPYEDSPAIQTTGFWLPEVTDTQAVGTDYKKREPRHVLVVPRPVGMKTPRGAVVRAADLGGTEVLTWRVDGLEHDAEPDALRLILAKVVGQPWPNRS